jgi:hypothetical protein
MPMSATQEKRNNGRVARTTGQEVALTVASVLVILALMVASYYYPYPSGERPSLGFLLLFWLREALMLVFLFAVLVAGVCYRMVHHFRRLFGGKRSAP